MSERDHRGLVDIEPRWRLASRPRRPRRRGRRLRPPAHSSMEQCSNVIDAVQGASLDEPRQTLPHLEPVGLSLEEHGHQGAVCRRSRRSAVSSDDRPDRHEAVAKERPVAVYGGGTGNGAVLGHGPLYGVCVRPFVGDGLRCGLLRPDVAEHLPEYVDTTRRLGLVGAASASGSKAVSTYSPLHSRPRVAMT